jgi:ribosomal-protein-alanine N-acetyltransferase
MILETPIHTQRLILRTLTIVDIGTRYLGWMADEDILRFLEVRFLPPSTLDGLRKFVEATNDSSDQLMLGIFSGDTSRHIGNIKLGPISKHHNRADLGFLIGDRTAWGKGFATEAISAVAQYALNALQLAKVTAGCYASNRGSARALEKAGFVQEARLHEHWLCNDAREDGLLFRFACSSAVARSMPAR